MTEEDYEGSSQYLNIVSGAAGPGCVCLSEEAQDNPGLEASDSRGDPCIK